MHPTALLWGGNCHRHPGAPTSEVHVSKEVAIPNKAFAGCWAPCMSTVGSCSKGDGEQKDMWEEVMR